jgi:hypothetical protein
VSTALAAVSEHRDARTLECFMVDVFLRIQTHADLLDEPSKPESPPRTQSMARLQLTEKIVNEQGGIAGPELLG